MLPNQSGRTPPLLDFGKCIAPPWLAAPVIRPKTAIIWDAGIMSSRPATIETPGAIATTASSSIIGAEGVLV